MASKLFLDANVILEYFLGRENKEDVRSIFLRIEAGSLKAYTSTSILQICGYMLIKAYGTLSAKQVLSGMLKNVTLIDCKHDIAVAALNSTISDVEDSIQYYTALQHRMDYYLTFDKALIRRSTIQLPIITPNDFLKI